ncbi:unnamed protein product [Adineta ricciae]|uniref:Tudor domain-containing protein n=1 Tax=Adineta ricciae TaxID=249248 RepID=A0A815HXZ9_ADIRI|nr:unnamed protein product [Adineta ricciae]CAF1361086.1 unnamed protein product [Adineta ricciae]
MHRNPSHGTQLLRRFLQQAESYNRCMFPKTSSTPINKPVKHDDNYITEQILFCQNGIDKMNIRNSSVEKTSNEEILIADVTSNEYKYETSSLELNVVQQCCIVSIISPYAFTIQLTRDLVESDAFFKTMNDYYNSIDDLHIPREYLRKNLLCVTWDPIVSAWNRSQIMEYDLSDDTVNVFFVDLNSWEEHVPRARLRFILTKYSQRPVRLLTCRLAAITPLSDHEWNNVVLKTFQNVVHNCSCDVEPLYKGRDNTFYVNLFAAHDEAYVCINDFLIHCKMARPIDDISKEKNQVYMLDEHGQPMHSMIALYWKAGETMRENEICAKPIHTDLHSSVSSDSFQTKYSLSNLPLTKVVMINSHEQLIFARYNSYIMIPGFTISNLLNELDEEKIKRFANKLGFKPVIIELFSHPGLYSQLLTLLTKSFTPSRIHLYSIDCIRKLLQICECTHENLDELLDRARLAEAKDDLSFWEKSYKLQ